MGIIEGGEEGKTTDGDLIPPPNFAVVEDKSIYRSGFPRASNFVFLQALNLRSVVYLCPEEYPEENLEFLQSHDVKFFHFGIEGTKESSVDVCRRTITEALKVLIDVRNHPVLIHCKRGKHRTGCLVGCFRKLQNWCLSAVLEEYRLYAGTKWRETDLKFLETYDVTKFRHCLTCILYRYQCFASRKRRLLYQEDCVHNKSQKASG